REHCTSARAFAILRSASQHSNVKLRDIASAIITSVSGEPPQPPPAFEHDLLIHGLVIPGPANHTAVQVADHLANHVVRPATRSPLDKGQSGARPGKGIAPAARSAC